MNRPYRLALLHALALALTILFAHHAVASAQTNANNDTSRTKVALADLRCEYFKDPIGIDAAQPRVFWKLQSAERGQRQTAYQVLVASSEARLKSDAGDLWDSGRTRSSESTFVPYGGRPLQSRQQCWWKVRVWDANGQASDWSAPATWGMGILDGRDWRGEWITSDLELKDYQRELRALTDFGMESETQIWEEAKRIRELTRDVPEAPAVYMRKEFESAKKIRRATAYMCGLGMAELHINGQKISDHYMEPAFTDYQKRALYVSHDVTTSVREGKNAIGVVLGNGWYNLITPHALRYYAADYIAPPRLRLDLDIEYADGSHQTVVTDPTWECTTDGPIRFNCVLGGETVDARKDMPGWDTAGFDSAKWKHAVSGPGPEGRLVSQMLPPVRSTGNSPATTVTKQKDKWVFDIGFETVGWSRLKLKGKAGQEITVHYPGAGGHTLGRYQTCKFICSGRGEESFQSRFSYNGYRYVEVSGLDYEPAASDVEAMVVCTDLETAGSFSCSDDRLNRLQEVLLHTIRNYTIHIPNDPTREKAGWTQDIQSGFPETVLNFFAAPTYIKWQRDFLDAVHDNGYVPPVVPSRFDGPTINCPWWGGVVIYTPWYIYQFYGDKQILAESYPAMQKYFGYLQSIAKDNIIEWGLGDWMEVGSVRPVRTPIPQTSTCAFQYFADILSQTAGLLDRKEDAARYAKLAVEIRDAYNRKFLNPETGQYANGSQTSQLMSLQFGLVPQDKRALVMKAFVEQIAKDKNHLSTGFVGTPYLLPGLSELGRPDLAWSIATQTDFPSFIDAVLNHGVSVMKEDWKGGLVQMPSLQGPIGTWFFHSLGGIRIDPKNPGFRHVVLRPEIAGDLEWVKCSHESLFGPIRSEWKRKDGVFYWKISVPPNMTATAYVPASNADEIKEVHGGSVGAKPVKMTGSSNGVATYELQSGDYAFTSPIK